MRLDPHYAPIGLHFLAQANFSLGAYDTAGTPLYEDHTIQVRCLMGNDLYTTTQDVAGVLPGAPNSPMWRRLRVSTRPSTTAR